MLSNPFVIAGIAFAVSVLLTYIVRLLARRYGFVAKPKADRWHKKPTAMMGGVAIYLTTVSASLFFLWPPTNELLVILAGSSFLFLVGLVDDVLHIKPYQKLIGQMIGAVIVVGYGLVLPWTDFQVMNICITVFWLIGLTNALNLLDNMDGLAAGIAAIAAMALGLVLYANGQTFELTLVTAFIGALLGFLVFNFNPASIFMGDCGSMFVGFFLASTVLLSQFGGRSRSILAVLAVPVLTLFVPIFDTAFVTILRKMRGLPASQGGRDHTSHRLVALGLNERSAVLLLYGLAVLSGGLAFFVRELSPVQSLGLIGLFTLLLALIGVYLAKVKVYESEEDPALENRALFGFLVNLSHKRRIFEVLLDGFLIALAYYYSYVILFPKFEETSDWDLFLKSLPLLIILQLCAFLLMGVYRGIWRYTSIKDIVTFSKAVILGSILSVMAILLIYRFKDFSRMLFVLDAILLMAALSGSRLAFRLFRQLLPSPVNEDGRRILIYGAGDGGELVLRELKNNSDWKYTPVGFVDDDPFKKDKVIHGLPVFGGNGSLFEICLQNKIQDVLLSFRDIDPKRLEEIKATCRDAEVTLKRAWLKIEVIENYLE
jgi:UDP-GlcNAc:undecaprenyl-phosphate GlcNAc-1-phosphate transferase